jgi:predicted ATPase
VRLFGGPVLEDRFGREIRHFRSQKVKAMLAYLALHLGSACPREVLYEALWPEEEQQIVANRFRVALASLRRQLEPEGTPFGSVLDVSEPGMVRLRSEAVSCDVFQFEALWRAGRRAEALPLAQEPLLPGNYEEWAISVRLHYELLMQDISPSEEESSKPSAPHPAPPAANPIPATHPEPRVHSLPLFLTRFFGREREKRQLRELIRENRLVTVTGIGGIGKTRLATETARERMQECFFVALGPISDSTRLDETILKSLGVSVGTTFSLEAHISRLLEHRGETLLILDSTEHLTDAVASLALRLLEQVPDLHLLVTSRQLLEIPGEAVLALMPLETPYSPTSPEKLRDYPAVSLFVDRATNARPDFTLSARNAEAIAEICTRLEGIPLSLELAAARITSQTPGQIAHALRQSFTDLKSHQRGLSERHRSLRTVIETSLQLLPEEVRAFFFALALFQDGWTIEMAQTMTGCEWCEEFLQLLAAASLVERREDERLGVIRFSFRETVRQFALQHNLNAEPLPEWDSADNLIVNGSFERDRPNPSWLTVSGGMFAYPFIVPFGWRGVGSVNVNTPSYAAFPNGIPDGANTAAVGDQTRSGRLFQDVPAQLIVGTTYTLSAWVGNRASYTGSGRVRLETAAGHLLADSGIVTPAEGAFQKVTLTFTAQSDTVGLGEGLRVVLERAEGTQANFDGVRLTASPVKAETASN